VCSPRAGGSPTSSRPARPGSGWSARQGGWHEAARVVRELVSRRTVAVLRRCARPRASSGCGRRRRLRSWSRKIVPGCRLGRRFHALPCTGCGRRSSACDCEIRRARRPGGTAVLARVSPARPSLTAAAQVCLSPGQRLAYRRSRRHDRQPVALPPPADRAADRLWRPLGGDRPQRLWSADTAHIAVADTEPTSCSSTA
jgi:hypothetical protein